MGSGDSNLSVEKSLDHIDCLFNFCGLVVGLVHSAGDEPRNFYDRLTHWVES